MSGDGERAYAECSAAIGVLLVLIALLGCGSTGAVTSTGSTSKKYHDELEKGVEASNEDDFARALVHYEAAADLAREGGMPPHRLAAALVKIGVSALALGDLERAEEAVQRVIEIYASDPPPIDPLALQHSALATLARVHVARREFPKGAELFEQALRIHDEDSCRHELARAYWESGDVDRAIAEETRAIEHENKSLSLMGDLRIPSFVNTSLGAYQYYRGDYDACVLERQTELRQARKYLAQPSMFHKPDEPWLTSYLSNLADCLLELGRYEEAKPLLVEALSILERPVQQTPSDRARLRAHVLADLALLRARQGRVEEARQAFEAARIAQEEWFATDPGVRPFEEEIRREEAAAYLARVEANLAAAEGRRADAIASYEASLELYEERFGPSSPHLRIILEDYLGALRAAGEDQRAADVERRLAAISARPDDGGAP